jgi:hypothetical protein
MTVPRSREFRFTIRDLLWLTLLAAVLGWFKKPMLDESDKFRHAVRLAESRCHAAFWTFEDAPLEAIWAVDFSPLVRFGEYLVRQFGHANGP